MVQNGQIVNYLSFYIVASKKMALYLSSIGINFSATKVKFLNVLLNYGNSRTAMR